MSDVQSFAGTVTIASAGTQGNVLSGPILGDAKAIIIVPPATLTGTVTLVGSPAAGVAGASLQPVRRNIDSADVTIVAGKTTFIEVGGLRSISLRSSAGEGAARAFAVYVIHGAR